VESTTISSIKLVCAFCSGVHVPNHPSHLAPSAELLERARAGDPRALSVLFRRHGPQLLQWAHGRLPRWARSVADTTDVVQDVLLQTFRRIDRFEDRGKGALRAYLRRSVVNRIHDEMRKVVRRPTGELEERLFNVPGSQPTPFDEAVDAERERHYKAALNTLSEEERVLVVGRIELGFNYDQLALIGGRATPEAARQAVRRAVKKVAERMPSARGSR
jgi:RNA polymerase sigma factor (sigma-70 family)